MKRSFQVKFRLTFLYEDEYLLIINKPVGTASIPSKLHPDHSMANRVKGYYKRRGYADQITHVVTRLDRDTTGVMMFAKHRVVHAWMDQALREKTIQKKYLALVHDTSTLEEHGFIDAPIGRNEGSIINRCVSEDGKPSLTEYWKKDTLDGAELVEILLHTGRTHQIRVHFSWLGAPLVGDDLYGGLKDELLDRQALHCHSLTFIHPMTKKELIIEAPLPKDMSQWVEAHKK